MNSDYRIEHAKVEHFYQIMPRDYDAQVLFSSYKNADDLLRHYTQNSYAFTAFYRDDIITIAGLFYLGDRKAEAWMFTGALLPKHLKFVMKSLKDHLKICQKNLNLQRIQSVCVEGFEPAHRFIKKLGFVCETPNGMEKFGSNGETYKMYARTELW